MLGGKYPTTVEVDKQIEDKIAGVGPGGDVDWSDVQNKPAVIAAGATQADARTAIGAGTSNLAIGTTGTTAKAGNYTPDWSEISGKPAVIAAGADQAAARTAIGAGTSSLVIGTTSGTALKGDSFKGGLLTVEQITQAAYDALTPKVATTLYVIVG